MPCLPRFGKSDADGSQAAHLHSPSPFLLLPSLPDSLFRLGLDDVSWRAPQFKVLSLRYSSSPCPLPSSSLVLAQHITLLIVLIQTCWEIRELTRFKNTQINEKKKLTQTHQFVFKAHLCHLLSLKGWPQTTKAVSAKREDGWKIGRSCWAGNPEVRTALSHEKDTPNCTQSAAVLLHFEIKLKH